MIRPNENPLTPASLATDGNQGASAKALGPCGAKHNPIASNAAILAVAATHTACQALDRYAMATDTPAWEAVEAANLLDTARDLLANGGTP